MSYQQRKSAHNLQTIQPRVAAILNKYRSKKIVFISEQDWINGEKNNAEQYKQKGDTVTLVLDKNSEIIWQSHR
jgi:hypothetical protein